MVSAIIKEIGLRKDYLQNKELQTIYFGGGTPSLLNINELHDIFEEINRHFTIAEKAEITLEANPDDTTKERVLIWKRFGINRLSIGIQSFNDDYLNYMNRIHTSKMAVESVKESQNSGIDNISVDLIYGVNPMNVKSPKRKPRTPPPTFTTQELHANWAADLKKVFSLNVPHVSSYCLTIEEKTVFGSWLKNNEIPDVDDGFAAAQFEKLQREMVKHGYEQYEISNFAKDKSYAVHNTAYWFGDEYLGVGPSAHSFDGVSRQHTLANNGIYLKNLNEGIVPVEREVLTPENRFNETLMTGLRTQWGISIEKLVKTGVALPADFYESIAGFERQEKLILKDNTLMLTEKGRFFADGIASALFR